MLGKPSCGWSQITVFGQIIGNASYLDDVPGMTLGHFIDYFFGLLDGRYPNFCIEYDNEGWKFGLLLFDDELFILDTKSDEEPFLNARRVDSPVLYGKAMPERLAMLAEEAIGDIRGDIAGWGAWDPDGEDRSDCLLQECSELESILGACREKGKI